MTLDEYARLHALLKLNALDDMLDKLLDDKGLTPDAFMHLNDIQEHIDLARRAQEKGE